MWYHKAMKSDATILLIKFPLLIHTELYRGRTVGFFISEQTHSTETGKTEYNKKKVKRK